MPTIIFDQPIIDVSDYMAVIRQTIADPRPVSIQAGPRSINVVDLPDATQVEADAVEAALRAQFPRECVRDDTPVVVPLVMPTAALAWTNMPAAVTEFRALTIHRVKFSLANFRQARLCANIQVVGVAAAEIGIQASTDNGATWYSLTGVLNSAGPFVSIAALGTVVGPIVDIAASMAKDVLLRLVGRNNDGAADPSFGNISLQLR